MKTLFSCVLFCLFIPCGNGQTVDTVKMIFDVLARKENISLIRKLEELGSKGIDPPNTKPHITSQLLTYAEKQSDLQGKIFSMLVVNFNRLDQGLSGVDTTQIEEAMMLARLSNDNYILANAYWVYGRIQYHLDQLGVMLVYYHAAYELFRELGMPEFQYIDNINFDISVGLYRRYDYRNSVDYGLKCFRDMEDDRSKIKGINKVYVLDILGAAYKELGMPDSSTFYYTQLLAELNTQREALDVSQYDLWTAIAEGRIGENCLDQGRVSDAEPLITRYYSESRRLDDSLNILLSGNAYAKLKDRTENSESALALWKKILPQVKRIEKEDLALQVCDGIVSIYENRGVLDSVLHYHRQADEFRRAIDRKLFLWNLETVKQEYEFMRLNASVQKLNNRITNLRISRNSIIFSIVMIFGGIYLFQRKRAYKLRYKAEVERSRKELAEQRLELSLENMALLKGNLLERNNLAQHLIQKIRRLEQSNDANQLISEINDYILISPDGWEKFKVDFLKTHPYFLNNLEEKCGSLTPAELRLSLLLYLNLNNTEIAKLLGISTASVSRSKSRLKQKFDLNASDSLKDFIKSL